MQTRSGAVRGQKNSTNDPGQSGGPSIFPTPTSLNSSKSPHVHSDPSALALSPSPYQLCHQTSGGELTLAGSSFSLPYLQGRAVRKTRNFTTYRRSVKRKRVSTNSPNDREEGTHTYDFDGHDKENPYNPGDKINLFGFSHGSIFPSSSPTCKLLSQALGRPVYRTPLFDELTRRLPPPNGYYSRLACAQTTRIELEGSLTSVFGPVCRRHGASLDTAFLAYGLTGRYCQVVSPVRATSRSQLYIASLLAAFKWNEEEDVEIDELARTILANVGSPTSFRRPTPVQVIRMEQRLMATLGWRLGDEVTPLVLVTALLDCIGGWGRERRMEILRKFEGTMQIILFERNIHASGPVELSQLVSLGLAFCLGTPESTSFFPAALALHRFIRDRTDVWSEHEVATLLKHLLHAPEPSLACVAAIGKKRLSP